MVRSSRATQKQIWADKEFKYMLEKLKLEREQLGKPVKNLGQLTKEMLLTPSFKDVLEELRRGDKKRNKDITSINIKLDGGLFK